MPSAEGLQFIPAMLSPRLACPQENGKVEEEVAEAAGDGGPELPPRPFPFQTQARPSADPPFPSLHMGWWAASDWAANSAGRF